MAPPAPIADKSGPPPLDLTPVAEPEGLLAVARLSRPEATLKTIADLTRLPIPSGADAVRSLGEAGLADAIDFDKPFEVAVLLKMAGREPRPLFALSVPVRSLDDAKSKLEGSHALKPGPNGQITVEGMGRTHTSSSSADDEGEPPEEEERGETCVLAPAADGARIVCGDESALEGLVPYLTRTTPRQTWRSDLHAELRFAAVRGPLNQFRAVIPLVARSLAGSLTPALGALLDASVAEVVDVVNDASKIVVDVDVAADGANAVVRADFAKSASFAARAVASQTSQVGAPPPAFWKLPADVDFAGFARLGDMSYERPKQLIGDAIFETAEAAGLPEAERSAARELVMDRMASVFGDTIVLGRGVDGEALDKAAAARARLDEADDPTFEALVKLDEAERRVVEQAVGYNLLKSATPITSVAPMLKDLVQLWSRPAFAKWMKEQSSAKTTPQMRVTPAPGGVTLPAGAVHVEISVPRPDLVDYKAMMREMLREQEGDDEGKKPAPKPRTKPKTKGRPPAVVHVVAAPDEGGTWLGFGLDGKLLSRKIAGVIAAPSEQTLGALPTAERLRDAKLGAAWVWSLRTVERLAALEQRRGGMAGMRGGASGASGVPATPVIVEGIAEPASEAAPAGSYVATIRMPVAFLQSAADLAMH